MPSRYHYTNNDRIAPIVVESDLGWYFAEKKYDYFLNGAHGWDNTYPEMQTIFIAKGSLFNTSTVIDMIPNTEIYQLLCDLLEIDENVQAPNNGTKMLKNLINVQTKTG